MKKLEKLTEEQIQLMSQTRDEWINRFFSFKEIDKKAFEDGVKWLYEDLLGKKNPKIIYCDSWIEACKIMVGASVRDSVWAYSGYLSTYSNYGWSSFYDYFEKIGVLRHDQFKKYKKLINSGVFQAYEYEDVVIAIQPPTTILKDEEGRMNSITQKAFEWSNGDGFYYVNGFELKEDLFLKLKNKELTLEDFLKEESEEVKSP